MLEHMYHKTIIKRRGIISYLHEYRDMVAPYVGDVSLFLDKAIKEGKKILLEGQLGTLKRSGSRNLSNGNIFLYFSSIRCDREQASPPYEIKKIVTVSKAYSSAVGAGAFR